MIEYLFIFQLFKKVGAEYYVLGSEILIWSLHLYV